MTRSRLTAASSIVLLAFLVSACGGDDDPGTGPSGGGGTAAATITITASGVSPKEVVVPAGSRVAFVNNDSRSHEMNSDPHPSHGDCLPINDVSFIAAGQTRLTGNLNTTRVCGYHDHVLFTNTSLQGTIRIQ